MMTEFIYRWRSNLGGLDAPPILNSRIDDDPIGEDKVISLAIRGALGYDGARAYGSTGMSHWYNSRIEMALGAQ